MKLLQFLLVLLTTTTLTAQLTPFEALEGMGRGINLGNTLEPPQESAWNNGPAQEAYFDAYVAAGFTNVRVPVRWDEHTMNTPPYTIDADWMDRVEEVVDWGLDRGLYITLNGHHEDWLKQNYTTENKARYDSIWRQIVVRFQDKPDKLLYEIINEPFGLTVAQVDDLNARILGIIREQEPTRIVIFGGNQYSNAEELFRAEIPDDDYIMGYYHSYDPWNFAGLSQGTWGTPADYAGMANKFQAAKDWSDQYGIPVHISEYGAKVNADFNSRMRWYGEYLGLADLHGFATSTWDDGGDFRVLNRSDQTWPEVKDVLIHYYQDSPNEIVVTSTQDDQGNPVVMLDWNNRLTDNDSIVVERAEGVNGTFAEVGRLAPSAMSFLDTDVYSNGVFTYRLYTHDATGRLTHGYPQRLTLSSDVQSPYNNTPQAIPGKIEVEDYDNGGQDVAYNDNDSANQGGGYRLSEGVDIGGGPDDGYVLGYVSAGEWIEYTVDVETAGNYRVDARIASDDAASAFTLNFPADATVNFVTPVTAGWNDYQEISAEGPVMLEAGQQVMRLNITGGAAFNIDWIIFTLESNATGEEQDNQLIVSPNPADDQVRVAFPASLQSATGTVQLYGASRGKIAEYKVAGNTATINVSDLPSGTYLLRLTDGSKNFVRRILIH
ncbi:cellulase family glycosylhydrolase [Neolewinella aurantiaca]|uniref:Cellulase family glycosylhydrolase n=1 Tax=Neolewinella aurantiaca TaxID=2602767 RepID=A0A5C7FU21_9BACT|nr:cellulase family glycosylhydrolase [Neolewinella aurantiaca]TXF89782.1 cellulase family glycosylhydrolase [Neolewinella aurantiaca]